MGPFDWNFLTYSIYLYNRYISPQLISWGFFDTLYYVSDTLANLVLAILPEVNVLPELLLKATSTAALVTAFKFLVLLALLIFIRGGVPRYRYDFLTKLGWIKFLSLILTVLLSSLVLTLIF